jgi:rod shape-determining protein MreC
MNNRNKRLFWNSLASVALLLLGPSVLGTGGAVLGAKFASLFISSDDGNDPDYLSLSVKLMLENAELREIAAKSRLYRSMLNYTRMPDIQAIVGRVLYRSEGLIRGDLIIDRGTENGVFSGAVCITDRGLVGIATDVGELSSTVVPITSPAIHVSCITSESGSLGILSSSAEGGLVLEYVDSSLNPIPGETVLTSRFGGVYPEGIVVGTVNELLPGAAGVHISLSVKPSVDFDRVDEVLILLSGDGGQ